MCWYALKQNEPTNQSTNHSHLGCYIINVSLLACSGLLQEQCKTNNQNQKMRATIHLFKEMGTKGTVVLIRRNHLKIPGSLLRNIEPNNLTHIRSTEVIWSRRNSRLLGDWMNREQTRDKEGWQMDPRLFGAIKDWKMCRDMIFYILKNKWIWCRNEFKTNS